MNLLRAELSNLSLSVERSCRDSREILQEASVVATRRLDAQFAGSRLFRFRIVPRARLNAVRVSRWMRTFAVREFFEDGSRDQRSPLHLRLRRTRLRSLKLGRRVQLPGLNLHQDQTAENHEHHAQSHLKLPARLAQTIRVQDAWCGRHRRRE